MRGSERFGTRADAIGFWLVVTVALRVLDVAGHGFTPDELGHMTPGGPWAQWGSEETASNPPLFRALISLAGDPLARAEVGRVLAWIASGVAAVVMAWGVPSTGRLAAWLAPLPFAILPVIVRATGEARAYALWAAVAAAWLVVVARWWDDEDPQLAPWVAGLAALLPWIHHLSGPWLALCGLGALGIDRRRGLALIQRLVPAGVLALPLILRVVWAGQGPRIAASTGPGARLIEVVTLSAGPAPWDLLVGGVVILGTLAAGARATPGPVRWLWVAWVATWAVLPAVHTVHVVRPPANTMAVVPFGVWFAAWVGSLQAAWVRRGVGMGMAGLLVAVAAVQAPRAGTVPGWGTPDGARWVAQWLLDAAPGDVAISPPHWAGVVWVTATDRPTAEIVGTGPCAGRGDCVAIGDRRVIAGRDDGEGVAWRVHLGPGPDWPASCVAVDGTPAGVEVAWCAP